MFRHSIPHLSRTSSINRVAVALIAGLVGAPAAAHAQDVLAAAPRSCRALAENAQVRVVECSLRAGESDSLHTHPAGWYYVTRGGAMRVDFADGRTVKWAPKTGESFWGQAEGPHRSANVGKAPMTFVLVEVKGDAASNVAKAPAAPRR